MIEKHSIVQFLERGKSIPVIDVRSPSEYKKGHIPGAFNIPLFTDEERKLVGTLYVKQGRKPAIQKGFEFIASKYSKLVKVGLEKSETSEILIYCWRGGMRSASMAWLYKHYKINVGVLMGGYKSYRRLVRTTLNGPINLHVIGGKTGSGKTGILKELERLGEQVVDLESLANHKGSAFGAIGESEQPSNEHFENLILFRLLELDYSRRIWIEDESRSIGRVFIPPELFNQMRKSPVFFMDLPKKKRIEILVKDYGTFSKDELVTSFEKITRKIGGQNAKEAIEAIKSKDYSKAAEIGLLYYDKTYSYGFENRESGLKQLIKCEDISPNKNARILLKSVK